MKLKKVRSPSGAVVKLSSFGAFCQQVKHCSSGMPPVPAAVKYSLLVLCSPSLPLLAIYPLRPELIRREESDLGFTMRREHKAVFEAFECKARSP